jgi:hypothetical protein
MASRENDQEDDPLCEAHKAFVIRSMAEGLRRQEQVAKRFIWVWSPSRPIPVLVKDI